MSESLLVRGRQYSPSFQRLMAELVREVNSCESSNDRWPFCVERSAEPKQPREYPKFFMGIQAEEEVCETKFHGVDGIFHVIGHVGEVHLPSEDDLPCVHISLTLEGLVVRDQATVLCDDEVILLANRLSETS